MQRRIDTAAIESGQTQTAEKAWEGRSPAAVHWRNLSLVLVSALLLLLPVWLVARPPLCDYPNHLARNFVLSHLNEKDNTLNRYYRADWGLYPYLAMDGTMLALQKVFSVYDAGKILVSLCVLSFPLAIWMWLRVAAPDCTWLVCLSPVICFDRFYRQGFVNYQLALSLAFLLFALWWPLRKRASGWRLGFAFALAGPLYCTHLIVFFVAMLVLFAEALSSRAWKRMLLPAAMGAAGIILYLINRREVHGAHETLIWNTIAAKLSYLPLFFFFEASSWAKVLAVLAGACLIAGVVLPWRRPPRDLAAISLLLVSVYFLLPFQVTETLQVDIRILPFIGIFAAASLASKAENRARPLLIVLAMVWSLVTVLDTSLFALETARGEQQLDRAISLLPEGSRILPIMGTKDELYHGDTAVAWYLHYVDYAAIEKRAFVPTLFDFPGQTELRLKPTYLVHDWRDADWDQVQRDYDFVWAYDFGALKDVLRGLGDPVFENGDLTLYRLRAGKSARQ